MAPVPRPVRRGPQNWDVIPAELFAQWLNDRTRPAEVADLGCGPNLLRRAVKDRHITHGFDHVAVDDSVTVCDSAHVPAEAASLTSLCSPWL